MANRFPLFSNKHKICVICEGNEEYEYFKRLIFLGVWNKKYEEGIKKIQYKPNCCRNVRLVSSNCKNTETINRNISHILWNKNIKFFSKK